jgi:PAS domain S-box-containing protein
LVDGKLPDRAMNLSAKTRQALQRYGLALVLAGLALFLRGVLPFREGTAIYQLPLVAVVLSAWYGGRGPGWFASLICITGALYWFVPPVQSFAVDADHALGFSFFIPLCLLLTEFGASRRRAERAVRVSEERFRALVQFSFDVYWESDARHRFTRQEFSERLSDAPPPGSELGKTRWEIPYLEPDEAAWREHRATLDAHLPFRDFELARPARGGGKRYVSVSGMPVFDEFGQFAGYRGVGRHITDRKLAEAERRAHVWFLESMDRINRAMQGTNDAEKVMGDVLDAVLEVFGSDRAWLLYPCDPDAPSWRAVMERTRPEYPGAAARGRDLPMTVHSAEVARAVLGAHGALPAGPQHDREVKPEIVERFGVQSEMLMALRPQGDQPYLFGLHQCSQPRFWTKDEQRLFEEIGRRLTDALGSLITVRSLRESEKKLEAAQQVAHIGWWERDYSTGHVSLSDEACRIFGVQPLDLPHWHGRWVSLIHPEDRDKTAAASDRALRGGPRYDVEYRIVRPDGTVRVVHSQGDVVRDESGRAIRQFGVMQDITELRLMERRLEAAQRLAHVGWWERDFAAGRWLTSDEIRQIYGIAEMDRVMDLAEWIKVVPSIIHPEDRRRVLEASEASLRGGPRYDIEYRIVHADGGVRMVHVQADVTRDEAGRPVRQFGVAQDITELRQAEQELRARQDMLDLAQKAAGAVAYDWYIGARESENRWSPEIEALFGLEPGTFDGTYEGWKRLVHPDDWPAVKLAIKRAHETGDVATEYRVIHKDGTVHWLRGKGRMFFDAEGRPERNVGFIFDVSDWRHAEEELRAAEAALRESEQRYRTLFEKANDAIFLENERDEIVAVNERACELLGYSREELLSLKVPDLQAPEVRGPAGRVIREEMQKHGTATFEGLDMHRSGRRIPIEVTNTRIIDRGENLVLSVVRDITERKRAQDELRASEARFRTFVDHAMDAFFLMDQQLSVVDVNRQACESLGYGREEMLGMHPRDFDAGLDEPAIARLAERAGAGQKITFETRHRRKDGTVFPVEIRTGTFSQAGRLFYLALARDITERKLAEETVREKDNALEMARTELARVSRLTTLGELTASIAHEVNQPIGAMVTNAAACARWLAAKPPDMMEAQAALANIVADGKRAGEVIARIRSLTKRQAPRMELLDVNQKVLDVLALTEHELRSHGIVLRTELARTLPPVAGDRVQLQQVLLNLIVNAIEAMSGVPDRPRELTIVTAKEPGAVLVEVRDSGPGLDEEGGERVFEPFYTTKVQGIGIGLSISRSIVEAHGGRLWANPNEPHGAVFRFTLPLAPKGQS